MHYYGYKISKKSPYIILGTTYFQQSIYLKNEIKISKSDNTFHSRFKFKILKCFNNKTDALEQEELLHKKFNAAKHPCFYNRINSSKKFQTAGFVYAINISTGCGEYISVEKFREDNNFCHPSQGTVVAIDRESGLSKRISLEEYVNNKSKFAHSRNGKVVVIDLETNETKNVDKSEFDEYKNIKFKSVNKDTKLQDSTRSKMSAAKEGTTLIRNIETGTVLRVTTEEYHSVYKNSKLYKSIYSKKKQKETRLKFSAVAKGMLTVHNVETGMNCRIQTEEFYKNRDLYLTNQQIKKLASHSS